MIPAVSVFERKGCREPLPLLLRYVIGFSVVGLVVVGTMEAIRALDRSTCCYFNPLMAMHTRKTNLEMAVGLLRQPCALVFVRELLEHETHHDDYGTELLTFCDDEGSVSVISAGRDRLFGTFDDLGLGDVWCSWPVPVLADTPMDRNRNFCRRRYSPW